MSTSSLILFNKPYGVQSQFRDDSNNDHTTLSEFFTDKSLRVAGRLDATSEGLLILTSDGRINKAITHPPKAPSRIHQRPIKGINKARLT
ncbi:pseudouridine synthase [Psychrobacter sp. ENNN9_III]|uniref:pseudouridine synthase n=1 Tax=Psychrobacter sp. ENNN9_III TaxID=1254334 RepID=UPI000AD981CD|nr:pseudouridine synthase [Psychrobacter sp. ENNN9_III]